MGEGPALWRPGSRDGEGFFDRVAARKAAQTRLDRMGVTALPSSRVDAAHAFVERWTPRARELVGLYADLPHPDTGGPAQTLSRRDFGMYYADRALDFADQVVLANGLAGGLLLDDPRWVSRASARIGRCAAGTIRNISGMSEGDLGLVTYVADDLCVDEDDPMARGLRLLLHEEAHRDQAFATAPHARVNYARHVARLLRAAEPDPERQLRLLPLLLVSPTLETARLLKRPIPEAYAHEIDLWSGLRALHEGLAEHATWRARSDVPQWRNLHWPDAWLPGSNWFSQSESSTEPHFFGHAAVEAIEDAEREDDLAEAHRGETGWTVRAIYEHGWFPGERRLRQPRTLVREVHDRLSRL